MQATPLAAVPFVMRQVGTGLQRSWLDVSQMRPVADVQAPVVQLRLGVLDAVAAGARSVLAALATSRRAGSGGDGDGDGGGDNQPATESVSHHTNRAATTPSII